MGKYTGQKYMPSNGTEGDSFCLMFCDHCIHEKFNHTQNHKDKQCDIYSRSIIYWYTDDPRYPKEWIYDENDHPTCTAYVKWDWDNDGDPDDPDNPLAPTPYNPNQLTLPFIFDEVEENTVITKELISQ